MTTLVVGDVHGCADELRTLLDRVDADRVVLVGDLYTKGPDPAGVWDLVREHDAEAVLGNHDARLLDALAGERPKDRGAARCLEKLAAGAPGWRAHLASLPLFLEDVAGFTVVHAGLHPSGDLIQTTKSMAVGMRRFGDGPDAPYWHEVYEGARRVVFGHDARLGSVWREREGEPWVVGLDSGCVYGGVLTGFVIETRCQVQVPAQRVYKGVGH